MPTKPQYEALDAQGYAYMREPRVIGELPIAARRPTLDAAITKVSDGTDLSLEYAN